MDKRVQKKRLHITGCPRSGTTLLMEALCACTEHQGRCEHERSIFDNRGLPPGLYISKQPRDIQRIRHIFHRDKNLYVIYVYRDPRAVISSQHQQEPGQYFCNYRIWGACERAAGHYEGHARFIRVRYESLISDPDQVQAEIMEHFSFLKMLHTFSRFHQWARPSATAAEAMSGLRPLDSKNLSSWRNHLPRVAQQLQRHPEMAAELNRMGYEKDNHWQRELQGVTPIDYRCRYSDRRQRLKEWETSVRVLLKSKQYMQRLNSD